MPESEFAFLISGIVFGLTGGLTPGPLLTLIISETLRHGTREGLKICMVPVISDLPIVLLTLFVVDQFKNIDLLVAGIALAGAIYLVYLAAESLRFRGMNLNAEKEQPQSLKKGIIVNFLNPNPYIFWLTIGAPTVIRGMDVSLNAAVFFVAAMYVFLVGSKIIITLITGKSRLFLKSRSYVITIKSLGLALLIFAMVFLYQALEGFGLLS